MGLPGEGWESDGPKMAELVCGQDGIQVGVHRVVSGEVAWKQHTHNVVRQLGSNPLAL